MRISFIWDRPEAAPDPSCPVTRADLAGIAMSLADEGGPAAVTPERVAAVLGPRAPGMDRQLELPVDLLDLALDGALGQVELPPRPAGDWRDDLRTLAVATRRTLLRHPWLAALVQTRPLLGPNALRHIEFAFASLDGLGLDPVTVDCYAGLVTGMVFGDGALAWMELEAQREWIGDYTEHDFHDLLASCFDQAVRCGRYPVYARFLTAGAPHPDPGTRFETGLECLLDGLAARIAAKVAG
ncbi:TetR/AcrR family transcriptional regulator C-terminal domain-containing protein [Actinomadura sp. ATCC 31491]|uniref:TetR/AcrR family transcriptional regulator C-terminal domain-containing protein n=1 Tax=Actinomadura luzonensis TaxID=2805427 RepID=A0ABT0G937_9ACTN|nr:TetR/AcrR family transcriptional regulator C-terminal domain-containing protein [Actinomadura luzonensis]MCK2221104.1 TetR/AcrR family transcriptional regulator C-terminal domain-containing protein [Actinomadura luzonensis]